MVWYGIIQFPSHLNIKNPDAEYIRAHVGENG